MVFRVKKMNREELLKKKYGAEGGWKVPEGYFDAVRKEVEAKLPPYPEAEKAADMSVWQRIKPYVYLAAMFAGIWCMMKVFHNVSGGSELSLDNPPAQIAQAMTEVSASDLYYMDSSVSDFEIESEVSADYDSMEEFSKDFGYALEPQYQNIDVEEYEEKKE